MTFALTLIPVMGFVGAAVDYTRASAVRSGLRSALDAGVLAGVRDGTSNWMNVAKDVFAANFPAKWGTAPTPSFIKNQDGSFSASVSTTVATEFLGVVGISSIPVSIQSKAVITGTYPGQFCLLVLNRNAQPAVTLTGNALITINAPQCIMQVNSNSNSAVFLNGNASIHTVDNCYVGKAVKVGNAVITPTPDEMCKPVPDPFTSYPRPTVGACTFTNYSVSGNQTITLQPGVYCGGMNISGNTNVTFAPGLYVIKDGVLQAGGGSTFTGNGVTFFLTGAGVSIQASGQSDWHLVAPTSGPFPGFVFFLDPSGPSGLAGTASSFSGQSELYFEGVVYLPQQQVTISGGADTIAPSPYTSYIVDTLILNGQGTITINNDLTMTAVPIPSALRVTLGGSPRLTM